MYYRESDTPQTGTITNSGFTGESVGHVNGSQQQHVILGLEPFTNYAIHVQAVVTPRIGTGPDLHGQVDLELVVRTYSTTDTPPSPPPTNVPIDPPSSRELTYLIRDPLDIDSGRVM